MLQIMFGVVISMGYQILEPPFMTYSPSTHFIFFHLLEIFEFIYLFWLDTIALVMISYIFPSQKSLLENLVLGIMFIAFD